MNTTFRNIAVIVLAVIVLVVYASTFVVDERQRALVVQFGEIKREINEPGLYFKLPVIESVVYIPRPLQFFESNDKRVQVVDGRRYLVDTITMYRIDNARRYREAVEANQQDAQDRLETSLDAALRATYGKRSFDAALSQEREQMMVEIRDAMIPAAREIGVQVVDVRIRRTDLLPEVLQSTYDRMSAERLAEAEQIRAVGTERSLQIRAQADRTAVILVSEAQRDGEILRGQGDAERTQIYADAYNQAPQFFAFTRSLEAYRKSLQGNNTTLVLRPDTEFFEYFKSENGATPGATRSPVATEGGAATMAPPASGATMGVPNSSAAPQ
ncbi:membrane protease subunit HflC [Rhodoligotrophos appendicifer]|uniref:protease modulator HflC n=1 Tax=Rhodoligotrophos appendicifer TaxID=987056 RepID=UPI001184F2BF|nr:protease modulator HflC [Rhodoligotrophos appendicifer]